MNEQPRNEAAEKTAAAKPAKSKEGIGGFITTIVYALAIALFVRTVAYEPFNIPSESMQPTLLVGDYIFVSKFIYGYSRHSVIFSPPLFDGRIIESVPERGDVAVFKLPRDDDTDYIKRIIGLPGDRIQVKAGLLHINGKPVERERIEPFVGRDSYGRARKTVRYRETLPNGVSYETLDISPRGELDNTGVFTVPEGKYFAMGDNRDNSIDSRVPASRGGVGFIPAENLVGRADVMFFSTDGSARFWEVWNWYGATRIRRIFSTID